MVDRDELAAAEARARAAHDSPDRHYHDRGHVDESLAELARIEGLDARERHILKRAILWHDIVHDPRRRDNEEQSARRAERDLEAAGVEAHERAEIARLIRLTGRSPATGAAR
ncbi:MAG: hypothetical protein ACFBQW_06220 [Sphingomonadaceae bacterium]